MQATESSMDKNDLPLVTIVTPTYNQADYLAETIDSVLAQDYPNIEYIVIDDGSTDHTGEILKQYEGRLHWERQATMGQAATLNKGWAMAKGKYLSYLSSDDLLYETAIRELVTYLEQNPSVAMVYPDYDLIDPYSKLIKKNVAIPFNYDDMVVKQECGIGPGALFTHDCFVTLGGWQPSLKLAPDREFWMRVGIYSSIRMLHKTLAAYRMHPRSISYSEINPGVAKEYLRVLDAYYDRTDIQPRLILRKREAYANARILMSRVRLRNGDFLGAFNEYKEAVRMYPAMERVSVLLMLVRTAISKPIRRVQWAIRKVTGL